MPTNYTVKCVTGTDEIKCHDCGGPADITIVCDSYDTETGYVDTIELCHPCFEARNYVVSNLPNYIPN